MNTGIEVEEYVYKMVMDLHEGMSSDQRARMDPSFRQQNLLNHPIKALWLGVKLDCRYRYERRSSTDIEFLFHRPVGSRGFCTTYTFARCDRGEWEFLSSHDSCWRSAVRDYIWAREVGLVEEATNNAGLEKHLPYSQYEWKAHLPFADFFCWKDVIMRRDPEDKHGYKKTVELV